MTGRSIEAAGHPNVGHHGLAWLLNDDDRYDPAYGGLDSLRDEIVDEQQGRVVLSSEDFEYLHARPDSLERLRGVLDDAGCRTTVVLYVRPQADYIQSIYLELLKHGLAATLAEFARTAISNGQVTHRGKWVFQLDYERLIGAFARVFGADNVVVRAYSSIAPEARLLDDFLELLYGRRAFARRDAFVFPARQNQRVGADAALELLRRNCNIGQTEEYRTFQLAGDTVAKISARFERSNAALARYLGAPLPVAEVPPLRELAGSGVAGA